MIRGLIKTAIVAWVSEKLFERLTRSKKKTAADTSSNKTVANRRPTPTKRTHVKAA